MSESRRLWLVALGALFVFYLPLFAARALPAGHDAFQYLTLQHYFWARRIADGEIPLWIPEMTHGTVSNWWLVLQASVAQSAYLAMGPLTASVAFDRLFTLGMLCDELLLLGGAWLYCRRFLSPAATLFCALTLLGTVVWQRQPWLNFHSYYLLPLTLELLHRLFERRRAKDGLALAAVVLAQGLGNVPYLVSLNAMALGVYLLAWLAVSGTRPERPGRRGKIALGLIAVAATVAAATYYLANRAGTELIVAYRTGRGSGHHVDLSTFLNYGTVPPWQQWVETMVGVPFRMDYSLFIGYAALLFLPFSVKRWKDSPHARALIVTACVLILFAAKTPVTTLLYYAFWPLARYYRHISLAVPVAKVFVVFLAGLGLDAAIFSMSRSARQRALLALGGAALAVGGSLLATSAWGGPIEAMARTILDDITLPVRASLREPGALEAQLAFFGSAALLTGTGLVAMAGARGSPGKLALSLCALQAVPLAGFRLREQFLATAPASAQRLHALRPEPAPFAWRRLPRETRSEEARAFEPLLGSGPTGPFGTNYWSHHLLFREDLESSPYRTDHWLSSWDNFLRLGDRAKSYATTDRGVAMLRPDRSELWRG